MRYLLFLLLMLASVLPAHAQAEERIVDLRGQWRFNLGDDPAWANPAYPDETWDEIFVPDSWENGGFWGYDGYAWYRTRFDLPDDATDPLLYLHLGRIDDVDAVYVNGHFVGATGRFPNDYLTAYHTWRVYPVPTQYLKPGGQNVVAVRIYDYHLEGGILEGKPGLYRHFEDLDMVLNLAGPWRFHPGDRRRWADPNFSDEAWETIHVPGRWEQQGHDDYNGYAWYRTRFLSPKTEAELVLVLGYVDDLDEVYLNGERIGRTGDIEGPGIGGDEWLALRTYAVPEGLLRSDGLNVLAVRVYDGLADGGIYAGPVGLAERRAVQRWQGDLEEKGFWEALFDKMWRFD